MRSGFRHADLRAWAIEHNTGFGAAPAAYWASFESRVKPCGCGGHFSDINPPRCPHCRGPLHSESNTEAAAIYTRGPYAFVPGPTYDGAQHQKGAG